MYKIFQRKSFAEVHREAIENSIRCLGRDIHNAADCAFCNGSLRNEFGGPFTASAVQPVNQKAAVIFSPAKRVKQVRTVFAKTERDFRSMYPDASGVYQVHAGLWSGTIKR